MTRSRLALSAVIALCVLVSSCQKAPTIWTAEVRSPDGAWLAQARAQQNGGFGSAAINTLVYLERVDGTVDSGRPIMVLNFRCYDPARRPYTLDNVANAGGTINLAMKWLNPSHLEATYNGKADIEFQVVRVAGVDISVRDLSKPTSTTLTP